MDKILSRNIARARAEGRVCSRCGWMITVKEWKRGRRMCWNCEDALKGVNISQGWSQPAQDIEDKTGEML
jgi:hypothetical protein